MAVDLQLPAGFRFHPTDEELVMHYLCKKSAGQPIAVPIIAEIDLYKYDPWDLPGLSLYGEKEWYYFTPRDRKYPNGSRPNRAAGRGYWKATGADKPIGHPKPIGIKKALVFYGGKAPKGEKTNWIMHEYRLADVDRSAGKNKNSLRLDDWVLCRLYNKKGTPEKQQETNRKVVMDAVEYEDNKPEILTSVVPETMSYGDFMYINPTDSVPKLYGDSSCSEHVLSPEFSHNTNEVQSERKLSNWDKFALDFQFNYVDPPLFNDDKVFPGSQYVSNYQAGDPLQDMLFVRAEAILDPN